MPTPATNNARTVLPPPTRRGLSRVEAAGYIGVGASKFDAMVADNLMPKPKKMGTRRVWDVRALDQYFDLLPGGDDSDHNPWDD
ncbi:helix-turn-helix transcriptional regulator [Sulfitobacter geojensis]|uniref:helix-turn-helix transcriptional regulator n=1 Tax=Sulfitobacter geojensis TaxID=1342299 RepID=UPI003B8E0CBE